MVILWGAMEPKGHCDTAGPHGKKGPLLQCRASWNNGIYCDTIRPCGTNEAIVTLHSLMEPRGHFDTARPHETQGPLYHCRDSCNQGTIVTLQGLTEPWRPLRHFGASYNQKGHCGTKEIIVTLWGSMETSCHCDTAGPNGTTKS